MREKETKQTTYWLYAVIALTFVDILAAYSFSDPMIENAALAPSPTIREVTRIVWEQTLFLSLLLVLL